MQEWLWKFIVEYPGKGFKYKYVFAETPKEAICKMNKKLENGTIRLYQKTEHYKGSWAVYGLEEILESF